MGTIDWKRKTWDGPRIYTKNWLPADEAMEKRGTLTQDLPAELRTVAWPPALPRTDIFPVRLQQGGVLVAVYTPLRRLAISGVITAGPHRKMATRRVKNNGTLASLERKALPTFT
jgi:hypothetical protein